MLNVVHDILSSRVLEYGNITKRYKMNIKVFQIIKHDIRKSFKPLPKSVGSTWHRVAA
jgi:hypothetical protein